jgi:formate-dependent nitrite reductase membrane component NrfD
MSTNYERSWEKRRGGRSAGDAARESYYGLPPIHKPHWGWLIVSYFYLGGISSASYTIATIAQLLGGAANQPITRVGRYLSLATLIPCPVLLILDLGRPGRFHHMLRVLKLRSPMSVGTWGLSVFGAFATLVALTQAAQDGLLGRAGRLARFVPSGPVAALGLGPSFFVGGYTGVLLAATAVPLWTKSHLLMGPLFLASAMSTASAAIGLALALARGTNQRTLGKLERLDSLALLTELSLLLLHQAHLGPTIGRPLAQGWSGRIHHVGVLGLGVVAPLLLQLKVLRGGEPSRRSTALAALLVLMGGFLLRWVMVMGGRQSADDPAATFELTRGDSADDATRPSTPGRP